MRGKSAERLDFTQVVDLFEGVEVVLHALDSDVFASFYALRFQDFAESTFPLLGYKSVLWVTLTMHVKVDYRWKTLVFAKRQRQVQGGLQRISCM